MFASRISHRLENIVVVPCNRSFAFTSRPSKFAINLHRRSLIQPRRYRKLSSTSLCLGSNVSQPISDNGRRHPSDAQHLPGIQTEPFQTSLANDHPELAVAVADEAPLPMPEELQERFIDLVDIYKEANERKREPSESKSTRHAAPPTSLQRLRQAPVAQDESTTKAREDAKRYRAEHIKQEQKIIRELMSLLAIEKMPWQAVYSKFQELEQPRVTKISQDTLRRLLYRLAIHDPQSPEHRNGDLRNAYFAIIDDMVSARLPVSTSQWNAAIHLGLKSRTHIGEEELEDAMSIWYRMEREFDTASNATTLTIIYLAASKACKFGVAARAWHAMESRGLRIDRIARICRIYASGLRRNRQGILDGYGALVEAGEIIAVDVLEMVIGAFVAAGEPAVAEQVLVRLWALAADERIVRAYADWREQRRLQRLWNNAARLPPETSAQIQQAVRDDITPSERCYLPLIRHYAVIVGDLDRAMLLIADVMRRGLAPSYALYRIVFTAFDVHATTRTLTFTPTRLREWWSMFAEMIAMDADYRSNMDGRLALHIVSVFFKLGLKREANKAFEELARGWDMPEWAAIKIGRILHGL